MAERTFEKEIRSLEKGEGEIFEGEGILAVTKAALQAGVSYVGGYQGSPVSHLVDVLSQAMDIRERYGVHLEVCANEAGAAAMLGASIQYPVRGLVTWKSTVGTNVASDALSNLASGGVTGGAVIVVGEDYGEGASIVQERTHAFAMKSSIWLMDPRPNLESIAACVEQAFELSEATNQPVFVQLRILACHVQGRFRTKANRAPHWSGRHKLEKPSWDQLKITMPPLTFGQERDKMARRLPAAIDFIRKTRLNEIFPGDLGDIGIVCQGGLYNSVVRALARAGLCDHEGQGRVPIYSLTVTYPLVPDEVVSFACGKRHLLVVEEGHPDYIEQAVNVALRRAAIDTAVHGKDFLPMSGQYTAEVVQAGVIDFLRSVAPALPGVTAAHEQLQAAARVKAAAIDALGAPVPARIATFCTGCPERPVFSAIKLVERELGQHHISCDVGCHTFSILPPFNLGHTMLGYGLGLASSTGIAPNFNKRVISIMGDGGFWHNGLATGVASAVYNKNDSVLIIMKNGYTSATGWQFLPSSPKAGDFGDTRMPIENALSGVGVKWRRRVRTYSVSKMVSTLREALTTAERGLKVIIAESECMLAKQRRVRAERAKRLAAGKRTVRERFGIDEDVCTGDHSCIRLSGCPSLTIKENPDPLRRDPVAHVNTGCVGCGLCGEVAHAAILCPSFFRAEIVYNPTFVERVLARFRTAVIRLVATREAVRLAPPLETETRDALAPAKAA